MVFVNTSLETALDRNRQETEVSQIRSYKLIMQVVRKNMGKLQNAFGRCKLLYCR